MLFITLYPVKKLDPSYLIQPVKVQESIMPAINPLISSLNASRFGKVFLLPIYRKAMQSISLPHLIHYGLHRLHRDYV